MNRIKESLRGYAFITPNFLGFALFTALPVLGAVIMSFYDGTFSSRTDPGSGALVVDARFVGMANYRRLVGFDRVPVGGIVETGGEQLTVLSDRFEAEFPIGAERVTLKTVQPTLGLFCGATVVREVAVDAIRNRRADPGSLWQARDPKFWFTLYNTMFFMIGIPISMACSLGLAILLNRKIAGRVVYRTLLFLPSVATGVAMFLVWRWIYNPNVGLLNAGLDAIGVLGANKPDWLGDPLLVRPAIIAMGVWTAMGGTNMILFLAGLQGIDPTLYEAAEIDGAGHWAKFRHITWPQLRPTTFFILTTSLIGGFQMFDQAYVMTNGGPEGATTTIVYYIYQQMFRFQRMGYAASIAIVLFFVILAVTLLNWWVGRRSNPMSP